MSRTVDFFNKFNHFSVLKETSGVVSNEYKDLVADSFTFGKLSHDKGGISASDYEGMIDVVPDNMEAYVLEHMEDLSTVKNKARQELEVMKIEEMRANDYEPMVKAA